MTEKRRRDTLLIALILVYGLAVMCWGLFRDPLSPDEAKSIYMGRQVMSGSTLSCPPRVSDYPSGALENLMCAYSGSVVIAPFTIAFADFLAGICGARLVGAVLGLVLVIMVYRTGNSPTYSRHGTLAAATFVFLGLPLQLSAIANSSVFAVFFVGLSLMLIEDNAESGSARHRRGMLLLASLSFAVAAMTSYVVVVFAVLLVPYVFLRYRFFAWSLFFLIPLMIVLTLYGYFAVLPAWPALQNTLELSLSAWGMTPSSRFVYVFDWLAMPYLLATFGMFHGKGGKNSFLLMVLASPAFFIPLMSSTAGDIHTAVFISLVFLAPAAALGVAHMGELFSYNNAMSLVKPFFVTAILTIIWVFGIQQIKELKRERPDLSSAVGFLRQKGTARSTVLVDSDYGSPEYVYRYYLETKTTPARVIPLARGGEKERKDMVIYTHPDYVVVDDHHSDRSFDRACSDYEAQGFRLAAAYRMSPVSGVKNIRIFQKGAL
jgi:hypothetical protein